jgi:Putative adhesin
MKLRARAFSVFAAVVLTLATAAAAAPVVAAQDGHFDRTLTVSGSVDLDVQTGSGEIRVHPGDAGKVEIHAKIHVNGSHLGDAEGRVHQIESNPPIEQSGNTIRVGHSDDHELLRNISISYDITVPADTKLHSASGSGDQTIDGIRGPLDATSGSGSLHASKIGAEARVRTGSGDIELNSVQGSTHASTGSGSIRALGISGGLTASSGSGSVILEQAAAGDVDVSTGSGEVELKRVKGAVRASTGSGTIVAQGQPTGAWKLRTGSGDVRVDLPPDAAFDLHAHTSSGSIESSHEIAVQGKISPRELEGKVHGGGVLVDVSTSSGSINIR